MSEIDGTTSESDDEKFDGTTLKAMICETAERLALEADLRYSLTTGTERSVDGFEVAFRRGEYILTVSRKRVDGKSKFKKLARSTLLRLWREGFIYFHDRQSTIAKNLVIAGSSIIIRRSSIDEYTVLRGGPIVIDGSYLGCFGLVAGAIHLDRSSVGPHAVLDGLISLQGVGAESHLCAKGIVRVGPATVVGAHCSLANAWRHTELVPLAATTLGDDVLGIHVGRDNWLGQGSHIIGNSRLGTNCVVAAGTVVAHTILDRETAWGNPLKRQSNSHSLRGLSDNEAYALGLTQGRLAAALPMYGDCVVHRTGLRDFIVEYVRHGVSPHARAPGLVHFHRGAMQSYWDYFTPFLKVEIALEHDSFERVRFSLKLDGSRSFEVPYDDTLIWTSARPEERDKLDSIILQSVRQEATRLRQLLARSVAESGLSVTEVMARVRTLSWSGALEPSLVHIASSSDRGLWQKLGAKVAAALDGSPGAFHVRDATSTIAGTISMLRALLGEYIGVEAASTLSDAASIRSTGIQSVQLTEFAFRLEDEFGQDIDVFVFDTLSGLAQAILER